MKISASGFLQTGPQILKKQYKLNLQVKKQLGEISGGLGKDNIHTTFIGKGSPKKDGNT